MAELTVEWNGHQASFDYKTGRWAPATKADRPTVYLLDRWQALIRVPSNEPDYAFAFITRLQERVAGVTVVSHTELTFPAPPAGCAE